MRVVRKEYNYLNYVTLIHDVSDAESTLGKILYGGKEPSPFEEVLTLIL